MRSAISARTYCEWHASVGDPLDPQRLRNTLKGRPAFCRTSRAAFDSLNRIQTAASSRRSVVTRVLTPTGRSASMEYRRWRSQYGAMKASEAKRLKELESENARLKKLLANQALDIDMLKELAEGNF